MPDGDAARNSDSDMTRRELERSTPSVREMVPAWCPPADSRLLGGSPIEEGLPRVVVNNGRDPRAAHTTGTGTNQHGRRFPVEGRLANGSGDGELMSSAADRPTRNWPVGIAPDVAGSAPPTVLRAQLIVKAYRHGWRRTEQEVLSGASLMVRAGEIVGLVGENGAGKSTLMKILVGSLQSDGGHLEIRGTFGYCPQEPILYERLDCDEHFELFGEAYGLDRGEVAASRDGIYDVLDFARYRATRIGELSGGTKAKLNLGLALLHDPDVLLLDEPYAGFDWDTYLRFWELASERRDAGRAVLIISHFVADEGRFDRVVRLRDGKIVE